MKISRIYLFILLFTTGLFSQGNSHLTLNGMDFNRFPLIDIYYTITDLSGNPPDINQVKNLSGYDISINNRSTRPVEVTSIMDLKSAGQTELYVALVFDNSSSMKPRIKALEDAARVFVRGLQQGDYACIIDFGDEDIMQKIPEFPQPIYSLMRQDFSNSPVILEKKIHTPNFTSSTYMYDAMLYGLSILNTTNVLGKKALIFFSDGNNIGSKSDFATVNRYALQYEIPIYAIDLSERKNVTLENLARISGGEYFYVESPEDLRTLYASLVKQLRNQFRVAVKSPFDFLNLSQYSVNMQKGIGISQVSDSKSFSVDGEKLGYTTLVYLESTGKETEKNYLDYLNRIPKANYRDKVELRLGDYWVRHGEYPKALSVYNRILRNPQSASYDQTGFQKAKLLELAKDYRGAKSLYQSLSHSSTVNTIKAKSSISYANQLVAEGNYKVAYDEYSRIIAENEGTDYATESLYRRAELSKTKMNNLDKAVEDYTTLNQQYKNSKYTNDAIYELADINLTQKNFTESESLFKELIGNTAEPDIKANGYIKLIELYESTKQYGQASSAINSLISTSPVYAADPKYVGKMIQYEHYAQNSARAKELFENSSPEIQQALLNKSFLVPAENPAKTTFYNGAAITFIGGSPVVSPLSSVYYSELSKKYKLLEPAYKVDTSLGKRTGNLVTATIPVRKEWITNKLIDPATSGIFYARENNMEQVPSVFNSTDLTISFEPKANGLYALLVEKPKVITLYNVYFDLNQATIRKDAEKNLYEMVDYFKNSPELKIEITGYTDSTGTDERNTQLSLERAQSIRAFMVKNGIDNERFKVSGYGSAYPVAPNTTEENKQKNRRTEFAILSNSINTATAVPTGKDRQRFAVIVQTFDDMKTAYEQRKYFNQRGYKTSVIANPKANGSEYDLVLCVMDTQEEAKQEIQKFTEEYKQGYALKIKQL